MNRILTRAFLAAALCIALRAGPVQASVTLLDPGFEGPNLQNAGPEYVQLDLANYGWNEVEDVGPNSSTGIIRPVLASTVPTPIGANNNNVGFIQLANEQATDGALWQTVATTLQPNTVYTLKFDVGNRNLPFNTQRDTDTLVRAFFSWGTWGANIPYVLPQGDLYLKALAPGPTANYWGVGYIPSGTWDTNETITFSTVGMTADQLNQPLNVVFRADRPAATGNPLITKQVSEVFIDNVSLTSALVNPNPPVQEGNPVPEPATLSLLGTGMALLLASRFRRRHGRSKSR